MSLDDSVKPLVVDLVHKVEPDSTVHEAVTLMLEKDVGCLVISEKDKPVGIITEKDILGKVIRTGKDPKKVRVGEVMSFPIISIGPETRIGDAAQKMMDNKIKRLIVIMDDGTLMGLVTMTDVVRWVAKQGKLSDSLANFLMYDVP